MNSAADSFLHPTDSWKILNHWTWARKTC